MKDDWNHDPKCHHFNPYSRVLPSLFCHILMTVDVVTSILTLSSFNLYSDDDGFVIMKLWIGEMAMRLFLGITFKDEIRDKIAPFLTQLTSESISGRAIAPENVHLTLIFLGDIDDSKIESLKDAIQVEACAFDLWIRDVGFFLSMRQGSTIYLGVEAVPDLMALEAKLQEALSSIGFKTDQRTYHPHVTIGRKIVFKTKDTLSRLREDAPSLRFYVQSFELIKSSLNGNKPIYETIASINLKDCR